MNRTWLLGISLLIAGVSLNSVSASKEGSKNATFCALVTSHGGKLELFDISPETYSVTIDRARAMKEEMKALLNGNLPGNLQRNAVGISKFGNGYRVEIRCQDQIPAGYQRFFPLEKDGVLIRTVYTGVIAIIPGYVGDYLFIQRAADSLELELKEKKISGSVEITYPNDQFIEDVTKGELDIDELQVKHPVGFALKLHSDSPPAASAPDLVRSPVYFFQGFPVRLEKSW
jgi:hypothetical protein